MRVTLQSLWQRLVGQNRAERVQQPVQYHAKSDNGIAIDIPLDDPLLAYCLTAPGILEIESLKIQSPALERLKANGIRILLPLVSQGELVGLLSIGPRLSEQGYTPDDYQLLNNLATQAATWL